MEEFITKTQVRDTPGIGHRIVPGTITCAWEKVNLMVRMLTLSRIVPELELCPDICGQMQIYIGIYATVHGYTCTQVYEGIQS